MHPTFRRDAAGHVDTHTGEYVGPHQLVLAQNSKNIPTPDYDDSTDEVNKALGRLQRKLAAQTHSGQIVNTKMLAERCVIKQKHRRRTEDVDTVAPWQVKAAAAHTHPAVVGPRDRNAGTSFIV